MRLGRRTGARLVRRTSAESLVSSSSPILSSSHLLPSFPRPRVRRLSSHLPPLSQSPAPSLPRLPRLAGLSRYPGFSPSGLVRRDLSSTLHLNAPSMQSLIRTPATELFGIRHPLSSSPSSLLPANLPQRDPRRNERQRWTRPSRSCHECRRARSRRGCRVHACVPARTDQGPQGVARRQERAVWDRFAAAASGGFGEEGAFAF